MKSISNIGPKDVQAVYSGPKGQLSGRHFCAGLKGLTKPDKHCVFQIYFELFS
jgi:hypothetical protein